MDGNIKCSVVERSYGNSSGDVEERRFDFGKDQWDESGEDLIYGCNSDERLAVQKKAENTPNLDRISNLPDEILLCILSFLPTEEVVRTGVLSKRWLYLWTYVSKLIFISLCYSNEVTSKFVTIVDQTLILHKCTKIEEFGVDFEYEGSFAPNLDRWVRFAMRASVEKLCLFLNYKEDAEDRYVLPQHVYTNSSIKEMSLESCDLVCNGLISWKSLKHLFFTRTRLSEDVIQKILAGSPVLECLELNESFGFHRLDVTFSKLRKLDIINHPDYSMEISAPNLQSLCLKGFMFLTEIKLMKMNSLIDCDLEFTLADHDYEVHQNMLKELLGRVGHVKQLTIGFSVFQVLPILEWKGDRFPQFKGQCLIMYANIKEHALPGIAGLLQNSPRLEKLLINLTSPDRSEFSYSKGVPQNLWIAKKGTYNYYLKQLKTIEIVVPKVNGSVFELVKFLLEKATTLEKMVIRAPSMCTLIKAIFLCFPRTSPGAKIIFDKKGICSLGRCSFT